MIWKCGMLGPIHLRSHCSAQHTDPVRDSHRLQGIAITYSISEIRLVEAPGPQSSTLSDPQRQTGVVGTVNPTSRSAQQWAQHQGLLFPRHFKSQCAAANSSYIPVLNSQGAHGKSSWGPGSSTPTWGLLHGVGYGQLGNQKHPASQLPVPCTMNVREQGTLKNTTEATFPGFPTGDFKLLCLSALLGMGDSETPRSCQWGKPISSYPLQHVTRSHRLYKTLSLDMHWKVLTRQELVENDKPT